MLYTLYTHHIRWEWMVDSNIFQFDFICCFFLKKISFFSSCDLVSIHFSFICFYLKSFNPNDAQYYHILRVNFNAILCIINLSIVKSSSDFDIYYFSMEKFKQPTTAYYMLGCLREFSHIIAGIKVLFL